MIYTVKSPGRKISTTDKIRTFKLTAENSDEQECLAKFGYLFLSASVFQIYKFAKDGMKKENLLP